MSWTEEVVIIWGLASYPGFLLANTVEVSLSKAPDFPVVHMVSVSGHASVYDSTIRICIHITIVNISDILPSADIVASDYRIDWSENVYFLQLSFK